MSFKKFGQKIGKNVSHRLSLFDGCLQEARIVSSIPRSGPGYRAIVWIEDFIARIVKRLNISDDILITLKNTSSTKRAVWRSLNQPAFITNNDFGGAASKLLKAQLYIQNNLDADLSLQAVAGIAGLSPAHFHRLFRAYAGETLKRHVDRLRVEKSLYDIYLSDLNLLQIALRYGFNNPETYSRVFRRHMGEVPSTFLRKRSARTEKVSQLDVDVRVGLRQSDSVNFSVTRLNGLHLAFIRHVGPYESMPLIKDPGPTLWAVLSNFIDDQGLGLPNTIHIGIPQDMPGITPPEKMRFDACMLVDRPFDGQGNVGYQLMPAGYYGVLTHAGPYATLADAYRLLYQNAQQLSTFAIAPGPVFELFLDISARSDKDHTWTELYLPLKSKRTLS